MKGEIVTFQLHRIGVALLVIGSLLLAVLIFAAGYITGTATIKPTSSATRIPQPATPPPPTTTTAPATAPAPPEEPLALRVGMFANEDDAKALVQQLASAGMKPSIVTIQSSAAVLYTVQVGPYKTRAEADAAAAVLQKQQGMGVVVVPAGSHL